jgi:ABC-type uncharacterized transport system auxiliary subunit
MKRRCVRAHLLLALILILCACLRPNQQPETATTLKRKRIAHNRHREVCEQVDEDEQDTFLIYITSLVNRHLYYVL